MAYLRASAVLIPSLGLLAISAMAAEENPPVERPEGEAKDDHSFLLPDIQKRGNSIILHGVGKWLKKFLSCQSFTEMDSSAESLIKAVSYYSC